MTEKLVAWLFLVALLIATVTVADHRHWSLDARPVLTPIQYVNALATKGGS